MSIISLQFSLSLQIISKQPKGKKSKLWLGTATCDAKLGGRRGKIMKLWRVIWKQGWGVKVALIFKLKSFCKVKCLLNCQSVGQSVRLQLGPLKFFWHAMKGLCVSYFSGTKILFRRPMSFQVKHFRLKSCCLFEIAMLFHVYPKLQIVVIKLCNQKQIVF